MSHTSELEARFSKLGGVFVTPAAALAARLKSVRGFICDWDGVFNPGAKGEGAASTYNEPDSMGTNLLRYALWRAHGQKQPVTALITGVDNPTARTFARREHFHAIYFGVKNKTTAVELLCGTYQLTPDQLLCVFDDVNDLGMAFACGVRVLVRRDASPLLQDYVTRFGLCDYVTGNPSTGYAVREVCELVLGLLDAFDDIVASRVAWDEAYTRYFAERQAIETHSIDRSPGIGETP
jgi:3-deoxy-D-manno-octulosonate 8-phosphate phosphatase (KDO 8-P phosphatase)